MSHKEKIDQSFTKERNFNYSPRLEFTTLRA
jgi:hypothetical protein